MPCSSSAFVGEGPRRGLSRSGAPVLRSVTPLVAILEELPTTSVDTRWRSRFAATLGRGPSMSRRSILSIPHIARRVRLPFEKRGAHAARVSVGHRGSPRHVIARGGDSPSATPPVRARLASARCSAAPPHSAGTARAQQGRVERAPGDHARSVLTVGARGSVRRHRGRARRDGHGVVARRRRRLPDRRDEYGGGPGRRIRREKRRLSRHCATPRWAMSTCFGNSKYRPTPPR